MDEDRRLAGRRGRSLPAVVLTASVALLATLLVAAPASGRSLGSVESGITAGPDGNLWAAWRNGAAGLYKVSVTGHISEVGLGHPLGPLAAGSDGNLWAGVGVSRPGFHGDRFCRFPTFI
jgi:hypothetical protein